MNQWDAPAAQSPALWSHLIGLLSDSRHYSEVLREVLGDDPADSLLLQLLRTVQFYRDGKPIKNTLNSILWRYET